MVSLSRNLSVTLLNHELWRVNCSWSPDVPPKGLIFEDNNGDQPPARMPFPYSAAYFGDLNGETLSQLVEVVVHIFDVERITGFEFRFTNPSKNLTLGSISPFTNPSWPRNGVPSEDLRMAVPIDGPGGECITAIEVGTRFGDILGLKVLETLWLALIDQH